MVDVEVRVVPDGRKRNPFIFHSSPGTLASLACSKVALFCWSYEIRGLYPDEVSTLSTEWFIKHKFSCIDVYKISLPSKIAQETDKYIKIVGAQLKNWMVDLYEIFNVDIYDVISRCIDHIIIQSNGTISYKNTAKSLLARDEVNSYEKYAIACKCCFESEVRRMWPSMLADSSQHNTRISRCSGGTYPMMYYWNCRMNNEPYKGQPEHELMNWCAGETWTMIEYFWNRLSSEQQSSVIVNNTLRTSDAIKYLLPKLSTDQLAVVLRRIPNKILRNLTDNEENCHRAIQVWDYMVSNGEITHGMFIELLINLCKITKDHVERHDITHSTYAARRILLRHIWISAPDNLKSVILNHHVLTLFHNLLNQNSSVLFKAYGFNMDFFLDLLINSEFQLRSKLWRKFWRKFIVFAAASDLKKIMELCLPNDNENDIVQCRKRMVDYETLKLEFDLFVVNGRCLELGNYLKLFCSSEVEEKHVRRQIIDSNMSRMFQFDFETLKKFNDFFDSEFSSSSLANKQKEEYFQKNLDKIFTLLDEGLLSNVKNILNFLLSHNQKYLAEIKLIFSVRCRSNLIFGSVVKFNIRYWQEFIRWCAPTDDEFFKFKNSLLLDDIFESMFVKIIERSRGSRLHWYEYQNVFIPLSNFLRWYFDDKEAVEKILSEKIANYQQVNAIRNVLQEEEKMVVLRILEWFFSGDNVKAREFYESSGWGNACDE